MAEEFSRQFSDGFLNACNEFPSLQHLKLLFDLVCIADGIAHLSSNDRTLTIYWIVTRSVWWKIFYKLSFVAARSTISWKK